MRILVTLLIGFLLGGAACAGLIIANGPSFMIQERPSPEDLAATVEKIKTSAEAKGWVVSSVMELEKSIAKHGGGEVLPVHLVNICQPKYSSRILQDDTARRVSVLMPCTIAVYQKQDGQIYVSTMNPRMLAPLFGGVVKDVMGGPVAAEQAEIVASLLAE